jgi:hypothetical protein
MGYPSYYISEYLDKTHVLFENIAVRTDMLTVLVDYGYTDTRIFEGKHLSTDSDKLFKDYYTATQKREDFKRQERELFKRVKTGYYDTVSRLRPELFEDDPLRGRLDLDGRRETKKTGVIGQAEQFYTTVIDHPDIFTLPAILSRVFRPSFRVTSSDLASISSSLSKKVSRAK